MARVGPQRHRKEKVCLRGFLLMCTCDFLEVVVRSLRAAVGPSEFLLLEALNLYLILRNAIFPFSPPSISLNWFRIRIIGNNITP